MATYGTINSIHFSDPMAGKNGDNKIEIEWTSDTGGDSGKVTANICEEYNVNGGRFDRLRGFITRVTTNPGTTAPTDDYDIVLNDEDGVDVMAGALANRDTANSETVIISDPPYIDSELTLVITNAGDTKDGKITIYMAK